MRSAGRLAKLAEKLAFWKNAFLYRNTPRGVLVWLEHKAKRKKEPREKGESIREFMTRLTENDELTVLADELEAMLYGGRPQTLSADVCRKIKKNYKKCVKMNA